MQILSFSKRISVIVEVGEAKQLIVLNPGERWLFEDSIAHQLRVPKKLDGADNEISKCIYSSSDFAPLYREYTPRPANFHGKRVLFYRNRGIGDQLIASCLSRFFSEMLRAQCFQMCERDKEAVWGHNRFIGGVPVQIPITIDPFIRAKGKPFFDYAFFLESVGEWDVEPEQANCYDRLFSLCGFDPDRIDEKYKRPFMQLAQEDIDAYRIWWQKISADHKVDLTKGYIVFQLRAENPGRRLPNHKNELILNTLNKIGLPVLCLDNKKPNDGLIDLLLALPNVIDATCTTPNTRLYAAVIAASQLVLGPDSSAIHFAESFNIPSVGFWGPFDPGSRVKYYKKHTPIYNRELCACSPCYNFMDALPLHKCPNGFGQKTCEVFEGITSEQVESAVQKSIKI